MTTMLAYKCDYCRGAVGFVAHRYWLMRFCSEAHVKAYQGRLADETRAKIQRLAYLPHGASE